MASGFGESTSREPQSSSYSGSSSSNDAGSFECNICFDLAQDPIVTLCGHLFCWPCLYKWLHVHAHSLECPVCKAVVEEEKLVPLYGRGKTPTDPRSRSVPGIHIPDRPAGQRPATAPQPDPNQFPHANPWLMGGAPVGGTRFGNYTISTAIGGLLPLLSFQVHGFPDAVAYGPAAGFPYGYANAFHGAHAHGYQRQMSQGQKADFCLKIDYYNQGLGSFGDTIARHAIERYKPAEWWINYGETAPALRKVVIRVLSQTTSSSNCECNWSTFSLIHTKLRNRVTMKNLEKLVFINYNLRLRTRTRRRLDGEEQREYSCLINLNYIFSENDPLAPWIEEGELPVLDGDEALVRDISDLDGNEPVRAAERMRSYRGRHQTQPEQEAPHESDSESSHHSSSSSSVGPRSPPSPQSARPYPVYTGSTYEDNICVFDSHSMDFGDSGNVGVNPTTSSHGGNRGAHDSGVREARGQWQQPYYGYGYPPPHYPPPYYPQPEPESSMGSIGSSHGEPQYQSFVYDFFQHPTLPLSGHPRGNDDDEMQPARSSMWY